MPDLTLEQVKKAGRFAYAHVPWRTYHWRPDGSLTFFGFMVDAATVTANIVDDTAPHTGWRHLPGCDCEFCKEARDD